MLTREEQYLVFSMSVPRMPDLSGMRSQYAEAIVKSKRTKSTTENTSGMRGAIVDSHGPDDNCENIVDSIVDDGTEIYILSVHIDTTGISIGLMILMLGLVCVFRYLKCLHDKSCWTKLKCCRTRTILMNQDGTILYVEKSKRNSVISGQMSMIQKSGEEMTNEMKMNEI